MGSTLMLFARLIISLAVVIGLMWVAANVLRKRGFTGVASKRSSGPEVELISRRPLGRNASIAVVRIGDRSLLVGVTEHQVTNLGDFEMTELDLDEATTWTVPSGANGNSPATAWKTVLDQMRNRTARR
jgi:flagellar biosynthetic protein FliO